MGVVYCGPYAEQIGDGHEGYAARVLPDGTRTAGWTAETREFTAWVAECECGWHGAGLFSPSDAGEEQAKAEWERDHLAELIARAERGWDAWAERVAGRAREVAGHARAGRHAAAVAVLDGLAEDIDLWAWTARELAEGDQR